MRIDEAVNRKLLPLCFDAAEVLEEGLESLMKNRAFEAVRRQVVEASGALYDRLRRYLCAKEPSDG